MLAGICRIIEICFVLKEQHTAPAQQSGAAQTDQTQPPPMKAWQHTTPFLLVAGGIMFMSATEEQIDVARSIHMDVSGVQVVCVADVANFTVAARYVRDRPVLPSNGHLPLGKHAHRAVSQQWTECTPGEDKRRKAKLVGILDSQGDLAERPRAELCLPRWR